MTTPRLGARPDGHTPARRFPAPHIPAEDRGAAAVEMAILLPLLLLVIFALVDLGLALRAQIAVTQAAREGVRLSALGESASAVEARVAAAAAPVSVDSISVSGCSGPGNATVTVTESYAFLTPVASLATLFGGGLPSSINVTGTGVMRCSG